MTVTTKLVLKDMPTTGITGIGGEGGWSGDSDLDFLVEATGTSAPHESLQLHANKNQFTMTRGQNDTFVFVPTNVDDSMVTTKDVERIIFDDKAVALDVNGPAGEVYALLAAALGQSDVNAGLIGVGLALQDKGMTDVQLADLLLSSSVYKAGALGTSNETFVKHVYTNITGSTISLADLTLFTGWLDRNECTQAQLLDAASNLPAFRDATHINLVGMAETGIEYTPFTL
ncbi:hypothetical protein UFOVP242_79 [uncultured Caudovirales phage]|uniref:Uncharacterized protein n=1 Tax=uncultured Caudovirales phage TaxID=2100421 RepID=A0A6J7WVP4_9CAUD|nr:hypothetical protein UFOVP242_79 [uncultured Caudovirales phage]